MLTSEQKAVIYTHLLSMYKLTGFDVGTAEIKMLTEILTDYDFELLKKAIFQTARTCKYKPKPSDIIEHLEGKKDFTLEGDIVASKITASISEHGYTNPEAARKNIGELGWRVVELLGGWAEVCKWSYDNMSYNRTTAAKLFKGLKEKPELLGYDPVAETSPDEQNNTSNKKETTTLGVGMGNIKKSLKLESH